MPNRLAESNSPYLLQHRDNPVDWHPWDANALKLAREEDKPIFLSIGYAACHWCHVMAHGSFEDEVTAAYMNEHFVNIKVDREERPDIDGIYMDAVVALTGAGGWPLSIFLTPDGHPFIGGTYFPPEPHGNLPSFTQVLEHVVHLWQNDRSRVFEAGDQLQKHLAQSRRWSPKSGAKPLDEGRLEMAAMALAQSYDWENGGWGRAPKFPQPMSIDFLLGMAVRGDKLAEDTAKHVLQSMARGGLYDVVGGGFARYSVDARWLVPHFEKMLYDNAQLARAYLHAYMLTNVDDFKVVCEATLDFAIRELRDESGGFYSSLDADSEGAEGKYYLWTPAEVNKVVVDPPLREVFVAAYGINETGNFEGSNILQRALDDAELADKFGLDQWEIRQRLDAGLSALLAARQLRVRPSTDDKVLTAWNGLMLWALAEAAGYLKREDYLAVARHNAGFLLRELYQNGRLHRSWRLGSASHNAFLEDYAAFILGLLALYQSDPDPLWYAEGERLAEEMIANFRDPKGGFFDTSDDHEQLITRPKALQDNATPSGNSLAALALLKLAAYTGNGKWRTLAENSFEAVQDDAIRYPNAFSQWLYAMQFSLARGHEIAIIGDPESGDTRALRDVVWSQYRPFDVVAVSNHPPPPEAPPLLEERPTLDGRPTAYVCRAFVCERPVSSAEDLRQLLERG